MENRESFVLTRNESLISCLAFKAYFLKVRGVLTFHKAFWNGKLDRGFTNVSAMKDSPCLFTLSNLVRAFFYQ